MSTGTEMRPRPNVLFILADQLRARSLSVYGERNIETPHLDRLAGEGTVLENMISTCPLCTPYRAMLLTGRHPQTTGHVFNHVVTRHDEVSVADTFNRAGYRTGWVGKWHLDSSGFGDGMVPHYTPEGRDRLGFDYWRGYNCHMCYFDGFVCKEDWMFEPWQGYETVGLQRYVHEFIEQTGDGAIHGKVDAPFCLFLSPHQPHWTSATFAPDAYYDRLPVELTLPANVPDSQREASLAAYRHYLAMTLALDDMVGDLVDYLERTGLAENTIVVFTSDHGSQMGSHGLDPWEKTAPYESTVRVPGIVRWPAKMVAGQRCDALTAPVDLMPTLAGLCGIQAPDTVEGHDLSDAWLGKPGAFEQNAVLTMNFTAGWPGRLTNGNEWRGLRTKRHTYARWLDGRELLFDLAEDPLELNNIMSASSSPAACGLRDSLDGTMRSLMAALNDHLMAATDYKSWFDAKRRIIANARGPLPHPESTPDFDTAFPAARG